MTVDYDLSAMLPDFGDFSPDEVLSDVAAPEDTSSGAAYTSETDIAERSRRIVEEALGEMLRRRSSAEKEKTNTEPQDETVPAAMPVFEKDNTPPAKPRPTVTVGEDGIITLSYETPELPEEPSVSEEEPEEAAAAADREQSAEPRSHSAEHRSQPPSGGNGDTTPIVRFLASRLVRRQHQSAEAAAWPDPTKKHGTPELPPEKAAKFYARPLRDLRSRCRISFFLCLILAWIAFSFPMAGMLGYSTSLQAGVSLVLSLAVMIAGADIVAAGARQLLELHMNSEAFVVLSLLFSGVDAVLIMTGHGERLPFCAAGSFALCIALWGKRLGCAALVRTFRTVARAKTPTVLTRAECISEQEDALMRSDRSFEGFVRRSEEPDLCRNTFALIAPALFLADLLLSAAASLEGQGADFLHIFSALLSVSASFSAFIGFSLPYAVAAKRLRNSGVALAGFSGCADIGRTHRIVLTDNDLFPPGTMRLTAINIADGASPRDVITFTASLLYAAGSGAYGVFSELMTRRRYELEEPLRLECHEGGGLTALIRDRNVCVGSAAFMNLMGIRLPRNMATGNAVCTSVDGELLGVFELDYIPVSGVQEALVTLMRGKTRATFAIRDFNISPLLIRRLFRLPTDNFNFPAFRERYRVATLKPGEKTPVCAVLNRPGMMTAVDAAEAGRRLYRTVRLNLILSLVGVVLGLFVLFLLCRAGSFDTASVGNVLTFMLLWTAPVVILSIGQSR